MSFGIIGLAVAFGVGFLAACAGFVWLNRNKAEQLDAAEGKVRDFRKP